MPISPISVSKGNVSQQRVVWMTNSLGYGNDLLYWGPILSQYVRVFPNARFFTAADGRKPIPNSNHVVNRLPSVRIPLGRRRLSYDRHFRFVSPTSIRQITRLRPDALVISEFTMPSFLATRVRHRNGTPILLLVESDPLRGDPHRLGFIKRFMRQHIARRVDWVLTNNEAGRHYIQNHLPISADRILCSPYVVSQVSDKVECGANATSLGSDLRQTYGGNNKTVFLYVGQLTERKGLSELINAVSQLTESQRDRCCFWFVGDGPWRTNLEQRISQHNLNAVVKIVGRRPYNELSTFYRSADIFVMPTLDDYRALVGFEALSHGLPLLHSRYDGAADEVVEEGKNGFVIDPCDANSLGHGIERFIDLQQNLRPMGEHSLRLARKFTVESAVESLVEATQRCLEAT